MSEPVKVARVDEIPPGEMKLVVLDGEEIVVANVDGEFFAFGNRCTHADGALCKGILILDVVECPLHAGQFNVRTGEVVSPPPAEPIPVYPVLVDGNDIKIARA